MFPPDGPRPSSDRTTRPATEDWCPPPRMPVLGLTVLWHPDLARVGDRAPLGAPEQRWLRTLSRLEPEFGPPGRAQRQALADDCLSRRPLLLRSGAKGVRLERAGHPGGVEVAGHPLGESCDLTPAALEAGVTLVLAGRVALLLHTFDPMAVDLEQGLGLVGASDALASLRRELRAVAALDVPVLLTGESGSGKELVARALHECSRRRARALVSVNLGAVPGPLAAAELFGAVRGAYTGAERSRSGLFRRAHGGTLFLDEVATASLELQALLLRACENGEIQPLGGEATERVDVRLVAATDADLGAALDEQRFRAPLLFRLAACRLRVPPLRARRDDVGRLLAHFVASERLDPPGDGAAGGFIPAALVARLAVHDWPGNVRELRNAARRLAVLARSAPRLAFSRPPDQVLEEVCEARRAGVEERPAPPRRPRAEVTDQEIVEALRAHGYRIKPAAESLGLPRSSFYERLERCPLVRRPGDLSADEVHAALEASDRDLGQAARRLEVSPAGLRRRLAELGLS